MKSLIMILLLADIIHDGLTKKKGETIEVDESAAERLVKLGVAQVVLGKEPTQKSPAGKDQAGQDPAGQQNPADKDQAGQDPAGNNPAPPKTPEEIDKMSKDELKQELSLLDVPYRGNDSRDQLAAMYKEALAALEAQAALQGGSHGQ